MCDMQNDCLTGEDEQVKTKELDCKLSYTILSCPFNINEQIISMTKLLVSVYRVLYIVNFYSGNTHHSVA